MSDSDSNINYCVIIPTYNNCKFINKVIDEVKQFAKNIIVINDGSTDNTLEILSSQNDIKVISYSKNKGKGHALKKGFEYALNKGFEYAITIDSDGQHFASDILKFINKITESPNSLIVGTRNLEAENMPSGNSFGNKFSNFWFSFISNIKLSDTQSGFRLYPLKEIKKLFLFTKRYEFELEILVKSSWKNIKIEEIPINVKYYEKGQRVSHFRPFVDFFRISLLNTYFVILSILFYKPFYFLKKINKNSIKDFYYKEILNPNESINKKTIAVMLGVFMGIVPIWGYQLVSAIALAYLFRLNKFIVGVAANISIPPMIPIIIYLSYLCGGFFIDDKIYLKYSSDISFELLTTNIYQYIIGSIVLALISSILLGIFTYLFLKIKEKQ